jgi:hypothetical protein
MSSKKSKMKRHRYRKMTSFISALKVAGAFINPNGMTRNSESLVHLECRLHNVVGVHQDLMVARAQVNFGEEAHAPEFIHQFFHHQDRELVLHRPLVKGPIIDAKWP